MAGEPFAVQLARPAQAAERCRAVQPAAIVFDCAGAGDLPLLQELAGLHPSPAPKGEGAADERRVCLTAPPRTHIEITETPPSSRGLGHSPLKAKTGVRFPLGVVSDS